MTKARSTQPVAKAAGCGNFRKMPTRPTMGKTTTAGIQMEVKMSAMTYIRMAALTPIPTPCQLPWATAVGTTELNAKSRQENVMKRIGKSSQRLLELEFSSMANDLAVSLEINLAAFVREAQDLL
jgi:hypothetical protein